MVSVESDEITIEVPNRFHYEWLDSKYQNVIKQALEATFKKSLNIKYSVIINTEPETTNIQNTASAISELIPKKFIGLRN